MSNDNAEIVVYLEGRAVQTVTLSDGVYAIGRTPDNRLPLPHPLVARRHAELQVSGATVMITDLGGASGTSVGEEPVLPSQPRQIVDGEAIRIGPFTLLYRAASASEPAPEFADSADLPPEGRQIFERPVIQATPRPRFPSTLARGAVSRYLSDLPMIYHDNLFLGRFLQIFESIWEPLEQRQDHIDMYLDPRTCPASFLPWLASWLDVNLDPAWPEPRQRAILTEAYELYRWRGTRYGLTRVIELSIGVVPEIVEEPGLPHVIRVKISQNAEQPIDRQALEDVIVAHKPAHVGYILELRSA